MSARTSSHPTPPAEWIAAAIGLVTVASAVVILTRAAVRDETSPDLVVGVTAVAPSEAGYRVELQAVNRGTLAAAEVAIEGTLSKGAEVVERRQVTLSYVPGGASVEGGLFFEHDPGALTLEVRPVGYESP